MEQRISHLELLNEFNREMLQVIRIYTSGNQFTTERSLQEIVGFIQKKFDIYSVDILLLDEEARELSLYVHAGQDPFTAEMKRFRLSLDCGIAGTCAKRGE